MKRIIVSHFIPLTLLSLLFFTAPFCYAQVSLVRNHKPISRIVVTTDAEADSVAAMLLQDFVGQSTQASLPVLRGNQLKRLRKGDVLIGDGFDNKELVHETLHEDGFWISTEDGFLRIVSGGDGGSIYAVVTLLEKYLGVNYWGEKEYSLDKMADVVLPRMNLVDEPAFSHRQTHFYGMSDPYYWLFSRYEWVDELFVGSRLWVHTFRRLMPVSKYGKTHPEYYAYINGRRRPDNVSQLCLTNPDVLEIMTHQLDSLFKVYPERNMISVSQNDGNDSWCRCEACQKVIDEEGSVSGLYLRFVNELARRFPDKQISTLSYLFTETPPKHVRPLPNVNIMLCNINCTHELPLDETPSGQRFMSSLEKWASMTNNIFLWDYGINFHNYLAPFPNFHVLGKNMQLFKKNHVNVYFHQLSATRGESWAELRTWLVYKLMWNPDADVDELIWYFLKGYYGETSAPYLYQYIKLMEGALVGSHMGLWIYDTPVSFKNNTLNQPLRQRYNELFDQAEKAADGDSTFLARLHRTRIELLYADLEVDKTNSGYDIEELRKKLDQFEKWCAEFHVVQLNEPGLKIQDYIRFYRERYLQPRPDNLASHAVVHYLIDPSPRYTDMAKTALTDGLYGANTFNNGWVGWEGTDGSFVIDLGESIRISQIELSCLLAYNDWIWPIKSVSYSVSDDNIHFEDIGRETLVREEVKAPYYSIRHDLGQKRSVRYIRVDVEGQKKMPNSGNLSWFFIDEVTVL